MVLDLSHENKTESKTYVQKFQGFSEAIFFALWKQKQLSSM